MGFYTVVPFYFQQLVDKLSVCMFMRLCLKFDQKLFKLHFRYKVDRLILSDEILYTSNLSIMVISVKVLLVE